LCGQGVWWACELGCLFVWCDMCAWLRRWCRMVVCSLGWNNFGPEGAAAISRSLASVPQLQTLEYVVAVCVLVVWLRRRTLWRKACGTGVRVCGQSVWACELGCGATCVRCCAGDVVWCVQPWQEQHRARGCSCHQPQPGQCAPAANAEVRGCGVLDLVAQGVRG
jgi:hypothetical protein